jgi:hypothetical protein
MRRLSHWLVGISLLVASDAGAQPAETPAEEQPAPEPHGIVPIPDYDADLRTREHLLGDPWKGRSWLAEKGLTLEIDYTQVLQSIVHGGLDERTKYGGSVDYFANLDLDRAGLIPGGLVRMRAAGGVTAGLFYVTTPSSRRSTASSPSRTARSRPRRRTTRAASTGTCGSTSTCRTRARRRSIS